jgi:hypothetical protein
MAKYDPAKLDKIFSALFDEHSQQNQPMRMLHRVWFRNILYYLGEQWFEWVRGANAFRKIMPTAYTPTPTANIIRDYVRSMKGLILNKDYQITVWPNSNDQEDRDAAEAGEGFLRWLESYNDEEHLDEKERVAIWMVICGVALDRTFITMDNDAWVFDKQGEPIKTGNVCSQCLNPFSVAFDMLGDTLRRKRFVGLKSLRPREWVEDTFKLQVNASDVNQLEVEYERKLASMVAGVSPWKGDGIGISLDIMDEDLVLMKEVEIRPSKEHPKGYYCARVGTTTIFEHERMPIPVGEDGRWDFSITDFHYHFVPGRFISDSGVSDLISPQNTINSIDQALEINRKGVGTPIVWIPTDVNMKRITGYGQSVIAIKYDALLAGGSKPEVARGTPLPGQVLDERAVHMQNAQDAAGDPKNVLRGKAPSNQASGVMVDILRDAAEQGHLPDVDRFYRAYKRVKRKQLILAQEVYTEERLIKIPDAGNRSKVIPFKGANLRNNTDVRIELASGAASTRAGQVNLILKLTEQGFFAPDAPMDPEDKQELLRRLGLGGFKNKNAADLQRAMRENEMVAAVQNEDDLELTSYEIPQPDGSVGLVEFLAMPGLFVGMWMDPAVDNPIVIVDDPRFEFDDDGIHYETHRRFIISQEFAMLPQPVQDMMIMHAKSHKQRADAKMAQQEAEMMKKTAAFEAERAAGEAAANAAAEGGGAPASEPMPNGYQPAKYAEGGAIQ